MKTLKPIRFCPVCGDKLTGRPDKMFCTVSCKSQYHRTRNKQHRLFSQPIDAILHRNWVILQEQFEAANEDKFFIPMPMLLEEGFHPKYYTTSELNSQGKRYHYVYNFGWMQFSEKEVMVIKLARSK